MADTKPQYTNQETWWALREIDKTGECVRGGSELRDHLIAEGLAVREDYVDPTYPTGVFLDLTDKGENFLQDERNYPNA